MLRIINNKLSDSDASVSDWLRSINNVTSIPKYRYRFNLKSESNDLGIQSY